MKTAALSFGRWIFLGAIIFVIGVLTVIGAGRRRGSKPYAWRIALWAMALSLMGGGAVMAAPQVKSPDGTAIDSSDAASFSDGDEMAPKCYKPMPTCYKPMPPDPPPVDPPEPGGDEPDSDMNDGDKDDAKGDKPVPPEIMPTCYEAMPPPPPPPPPTCYAPMPEPTCYSQLPPDLPEEPDS
jgi:hypothetical protein